jgi:hypothetical protein
MHLDELIARVELMDKLRPKGLMPIWERVRNCMRVVRVSSPAAWERARESVLNGEELLLTPVPQTTESDPAE